jgi:nicotinamidase-related amidase
MKNGRADLTEAVSLAKINGSAPARYTDALDPERTALVIVDMQGRPEEWRQEPLRSTVANCRRLLATCRARSIPVIHVVLGCWTRDARELSREKKRWTALVRSRGRRSLRHITDHPVLPGLEPQHGEIVQQKTSAGAFATTGLAGLLHNMDIRDLVVCGQISYGCAGGTAIEAAGWGYVVTMADDASAAPGDQPGHLAFLRLFQQFVGRVWSSDEVIRGLTGNPAADTPAPAPKADLTRTISLADISGNKHEVWDHRPASDATCLLIVDMQGPPEPWEREPLASVLRNCRRLLRTARTAGLPVFHVHSRDPKTGGRPGGEPVLPGLAPAAGETVLQPTAGGAFATTGLAGLLHTMGVRDLIVCGQRTYDSLLRIGNEAAHWGYAVTLTEDASAAPANRQAHLVVLRFFDQVWGRVRSTDEVIRELTPGSVSRV